MFAAHSPTRQSKLDRALREWIQHPTTVAVRTLIQTREGSGPAVASRLERLVPKSLGLTIETDLLVADLSPTALRAAANDADVVHVSLVNAIVRSSDTEYLSRNALLGTEGLLSLRSDGKSGRAVPYHGKGYGRCADRFGLTPNGDLNDITFFDFTAPTQGTKTVPAYDDYGHGTHVGGLIGSGGGMSNSAYAGVAPESKYIALKVLDQNGAGYTSNVIAAINWVVANKSKYHIDVINLSLGHPVYEPAATDPLVQAVENAVAAGIVVVAAAGNFGGDPVTHVTGYAGITSPGNAPDAITVGAVDTAQTMARGDDAVAWYSSRGPTWYDAYQKPDIVAPGSKLVSDVDSRSALYSSYPGGLLKIGDKTFLVSAERAWPRA